MKSLSKWFVKFLYQEKSDMRKARIGFVILLTGIFISVYYMPYESTSYMAYSVLAFPILSLVHILFVSTTIAYKQQLKQLAVTRGEQVEIEVTFNNKTSIYCPYLQLDYGINDGSIDRSLISDTLCLDGKATLKHELAIHCNKRGCYEVGVNKVRVRDILGLWRITRKGIKPLKITVLPKILKINHFPIGTSKTEVASEGEGKKYSGVNGSSDIRKYQPGDQMKSIHWKLYAKQQSLWTKCSKEEVKQNLHIWLDTYEGEDVDIEHREEIQNRVIESALGIMDYGIKQNVQGILSYYTDNNLRTTVIKDKKDFDHVYKSFCQLDFQNSSNIQDQGLLDKCEVEETIVLVTSYLSEQVYETIKDYSQMVVVVQEELQTEEMVRIQKTCIEEGIQCFVSDENIGLKPLI